MTGEHVPARPTALRLIEELTLELAEAKVSYCHWKSNEAIERSLSAENDLDLLIEPGDLSRFLEIAFGFGFRMAFPARKVPGHLSLYGLDTESGRLVQIDAQTRLVLGDDMTKNYRLPIESAYLERVDTSGPLPLPLPEFEYLVFVLRMVLKHCPWDAQLSYKARLTASERRELAFLEERIDRAETERLRSRHLPFVTDELFYRCRRALGRDLGPLARAAIARDLGRVLDEYARRPAPADTALKLFRRITGRLQRRFLPVAGKKRLAGGGIVIAVVGGDGSGKSSAVADLESFLRRHFATRRFHLGKPPPSLLSRFVRAVLRRLPRYGPPAGLAPWKAAEVSAFPGYNYLLHHLLTARDRYRTHLDARRAAGRGVIVVCDRYPLRGLETMDCPRLQHLPGFEGRPLASWIRRREAAYYGRLREPDVVLVLRVPPEVAVSRRVEQEREFVLRRAAEIYQYDWKERNVFILDAGQPIAEVQQQARALVWSLL